MAFTPDGLVLFLDWQTEQVEPTSDNSAMTIAAVAASEKYPVLKELLPPRPSTAAMCRQCMGTGKVALTSELKCPCGTCAGLGWVETV